MGQSKKRRKTRKRKEPKFVNGYLDTYKYEIQKLTEKAMSGKYDEEERSEFASQVALVKAAKEYSLTLKEYLQKFNTNLGLLTRTNTIYPVSLIIQGTGDNGQDEYISLRIAAMIGDIESLEEHTETVKKNYEEAVRLDKETDRPNPSLESVLEEEGYQQLSAC